MWISLKDAMSILDVMVSQRSHLKFLLSLKVKFKAKKIERWVNQTLRTKNLDECLAGLYNKPTQESSYAV